MGRTALTIPRSSILALALLFVMPAACTALESPPGPEEGTGGAGRPVPFLEDGDFCVPIEIRFIAPGEEAVRAAGIPKGRLPLQPERDGTWVYWGRTEKGTVKTLFTRGLSSPLSKKTFGGELEIRPDTHPADIHLLPGGPAGTAVFRFTLYREGEPFHGKAHFSASRLGRLRSEKTGVALAVEDQEIEGGGGRLTIDAPGWWWITARTRTEAGRVLSASLSFHVPEGPGPDSYAAFTPEGDFLEDPDAVAARLAEAEVIIIGEQHNDPVAHMLERALLEAVHARKGEKTALSLEMFERDVQPVLDGYLQGRYGERHFLAASRPWPRYATDYRPMVEYARKAKLPVIAANAPRRLVNLVSREGPGALDALPDLEKRWLPPLPYHIPRSGRYVEKLNDFFSHFAPGEERKTSLPGPRRKRDWIRMGRPSPARYNAALAKDKTGTAGGPTEKMPPAAMMHLVRKKGGNPSQSLWDATMAHSIARFLDRHPGFTVVQVNGAFHSDEHLGMVEQLLRYRSGTRVAVVSIVPDESFPAFDKEKLGKLGDVVILTDPTWQPREAP